MDYNIEEITLDKLSDTLDLVLRVFMEFEANEYSEEGVENFKDYIKEDNIRELLNDNLKIWIATYENKVLGIIASRDINHISLLFVDKEHHRKGIASRLLYEVIKDCKENNESIISVNSSPYARDIYERMGFKQLMDLKVENGIKYIPMNLEIN